MQVPAQYSDKYQGNYDGGYEDIRTKRLERMRALNILNTPDMPAAHRSCFPVWDELSESEQRRQARVMEIYAGMVDALDENIGRIVQHLKDIGEFENTLIVFMSDNGADARPELGPPREYAYLQKNYDNRLENLGSEDSFVSYGGAWGEVGSTPLRLHKSMPTEGGVRVPAIVHLPGSKAAPWTAGEFVSVMDLLPTFLEIAQTTHPGSRFRERTVLPPAGRSMLPYLSGDASYVHKDEPYGFSVHRRQGLQVHQWKILRLPEPHGDYHWELYNLETDPGESINLAKTMPDKLAEMITRWNDFAAETGLIVSEEGSRVPKTCG